MDKKRAATPRRPRHRADYGLRGKGYVSVSEAAAIIGCSPSQVYTFARAGRFNDPVAEGVPGIVRPPSGSGPGTWGLWIHRDAAARLRPAVAS